MTTATKTDRTALAAQLEDLAREHQELLAPLTAEVTVAMDAHAKAAEVLDGAARIVQEARLAVAAEGTRRDRTRGPIERELRDDVAAKLAEFRAWCVNQRDTMSSKASTVGADELRALQARSGMVPHAIQEIERLGLLADDELEKRLSDLRAEIGDGSE